MATSYDFDPQTVDYIQKLKILYGVHTNKAAIQRAIAQVIELAERETLEGGRLYLSKAPRK